MFKVSPISGIIDDINCVRLNYLSKNSIDQPNYVKVTYRDVCCYFKAIEYEHIPTDVIEMDVNARKFLGTVFYSEVKVEQLYYVKTKKENVLVNVIYIGSGILTDEEITKDFLTDNTFKNRFKDVPLVNGLDYLYTFNHSYIVNFRNINNEYVFLGGFTLNIIPSTSKKTELSYSPNCCNHPNYPVSFQTKKHNDEVFNSDFNFDDLGIGGLDEQFKQIFRVAFASRILSTESNSMGVKPPKGILLYGPPGTGKTLIARKLSNILNAKSFQIVNGPELLNKYVGQSAENARNLFIEAEIDSKNSSPGLHVIVFDEFDAIGKRRSNESCSSSSNNDVVTQLLSKIEGVEELNNILIIAMTNLKETLDPALLRSGRIELHIEIGLPDRNGRKKIFEIHTKKIRENGHISFDVDFDELANITTNFTGAEIKSVVAKASTYPLTKLIDPKTMKKINSEKIIKPIVNMQDFIAAISETVPVMGSVNKEIDLITSKMLDLSNESFKNKYENLLNSINNYFLNGHERSVCRNFTVLISGETFTGKTKLVAHAVKNLMKLFSHIKFITPEKYLNENIKIWNAFQEGKRSDNFLLILDSIENMFDYSIGGFMPQTTRELLSIINSNIEPDKKVVTILTCSDRNMISVLELERKVTIHYCL